MLGVKLEDNSKQLETLITKINDIGGPFVARVNESKGYGLFADKDYDEHEVITVYGGRRHTEYPANSDGRFLLKVLADKDNTWHIDGAFDFLPHEKGRWINHASDNDKEIDLDASDSIDSDGPNAAFQIANGTLTGRLSDLVMEVVAIERIRRGDEITVDYGDQYDSSLLSE